jgi:sugar phosphate permease
MRYPGFPGKTARLYIKMKDFESLNEDLDVNQWQEGKRRVWIAAMFLGTMFLYAARSAVPLCMAAMSKDLSWDKEADVSVLPLS